MKHCHGEITFTFHTHIHIKSKVSQPKKKKGSETVSRIVAPANSSLTLVPFLGRDKRGLVFSRVVSSRPVQSSSTMGLGLGRNHLRSEGLGLAR